jgi:flavin-binding protein dodecin
MRWTIDPKWPDGSAAARPFLLLEPVACGTRKHAAPHPFSAAVPMLGFSRGRSTCVLPDIQREDDMAESVYKVIELIGTSKESWEKAAAAAVNRAGKSLRDLRVAEVVQLDLQLDAKGKVEAYRAKIKVSFKFEG